MKVSKRCDRRLAHQRIKGGSSETDVKELTVMPMGWRSAVCAVTSVTPVGKDPNALRNARVSKLIGPASGAGKQPHYHQRQIIATPEAGPMSFDTRAFRNALG